MNKIRALLFDLDGTLVDTNSMHVDAWACALRDAGAEVARARIEEQIGKGGDHLLPTLLGPERASADGPRVERARAQRFQQLVKARGVSFLRGAHGVLIEAKSYRYRTAIVTSASSDDLSCIGRALGVDLANLVDAVVCGDVVDATKPAPDLVVRGCEALRLPPSRCAVVGDSVFDGISASRAGAMFMGVRTGYASRADLADAGARVILKNLDVLARGLVGILSSLGEGTLTMSDRP